MYTPKAEGYEDYFGPEKFKGINVLANHNNVFCTESLEIAVPEIKKFIGE